METLKLGIKAVGVGKSGSKPIEDELAVELIKVIQASAAPPTDWASELDNIRQRLSSFLGTLFVRPSLSHAAARAHTHVMCTHAHMRTRARAHARTRGRILTRGRGRTHTLMAGQSGTLRWRPGSAQGCGCGGRGRDRGL